MKQSTIAGKDICQYFDIGHYFANYRIMTNISSKLGYIPEICPACKQTCTYIFAISKGSVESLKKIARYIQIKQENRFHARKELEGKFLTSSQIANLSILRSHGLIARYKENGKKVIGYYLLTSKGAEFLRGESIPRYAIISKAEGHQIGYFNPQTLTCRINDFNDPGEPYWEIINFTIEDGRVFTSPQAKLL